MEEVKWFEERDEDVAKDAGHDAFCKEEGFSPSDSHAYYAFEKGWAYAMIWAEENA